ncbi:unnamed protein product [Rhizopus stolonifer]
MNQETFKVIQDTVIHYIEKWKPTEKIKPTQVATIGLSGIAGYFLYKTLIYRLFLHPLNKIPGPRVSWIPFMGNFFDVMLSEIEDSPFIKWAEEYGGIFKYHHHWNEPQLVVTDPQLLKQILTTQIYDFSKPDFAIKDLTRVAGIGVLVAEGDVHRVQRKMLNPAFSVQSIRGMVPLMLGPGYTLRDQWIQKMMTSDKEFTEITVSGGLSLATLDVIGITAFGQDFKSLKNYGTEKMNRFAKAYLQLFDGDMPMIKVLSLFIPLLEYFPTKRDREDAVSLKWLHEESAALVDAGIQRNEKEKDYEKDKKSKDLLSLMVNLIDEETGKGFTKEELRNQCLTFLAAGHETTSNTLCWCLWLLAGHQDVQDRLRTEIQSLFKDGKITDYDAVNALPYLDHVCRETLRRIPTVPRTVRVSLKQVALGPHVVPKGTVIHISPIVSQLSKEIWGEDALEFNPSRWEKAQVGNAYQFFPFLVGGHQCIGHRFATIEMKVLLAILIKDIQFFEKPQYVIKKKQVITTKPIPDMTLWTKPVSS